MWSVLLSAAAVSFGRGRVPSTRYGLRIGEQLRGQVTTGFLQIESFSGPSPDGSLFVETSNTFMFGYEGELLVFASTSPSGE